MYEKQQLRGKWFTDTLGGPVTSQEGNFYGKVFSNNGYFTTIYPMETKGKAGDALRTFCLDLRVPEKLTCDGSKEQTGKKTKFIKQVCRNDIKLHVMSQIGINRIRAKA